MAMNENCVVLHNNTAWLLDDVRYIDVSNTKIDRLKPIECMEVERSFNINASSSYNT